MELDREVIDRFRHGDELAFGIIFDAYYGALVRYAHTILRDMDEAEDVVQSVFIRIWQGRERLDEVVMLRSVLYKAVQNGCFNKLKHLKVRAVHAKSVQHYGEQYDYNEGVLNSELQRRIEEVIEGLPAQCGKIFKMSRFEEMKYQEIADALGLSVKTVENQMGKALKILRVELKDYLPLVLIFLSRYYGG